LDLARLRENVIYRSGSGGVAVFLDRLEASAALLPATKGEALVIRGRRPMQGGADRSCYVCSEAPWWNIEMTLASTIKRSGESGPCAILAIGRKMGKEGGTPWPDCRAFKHG
jgi:hypothetical protein